MSLNPKEQADILVKMHETAWLNFDRRRSYEWKLSLGIWTAAAAFTALLLGKDVDLQKLAEFRGTFCFVAAAIIAVHLYFLYQHKKANECDQMRALFYEDRLNGMLLTFVFLT